MNKVVELCPFCEEEVKLEKRQFFLQKCPNCGKPIRACSLCDQDIVNCSECEKKYSHFPTCEEIMKGGK